MNDNFFLQILMRERERDILEEVRRCDYQTHRHPRDSGSSKEIEGRVLSVLTRMKVIARNKQKRQQAADKTAEISDPMLSLDRKVIDSDMGPSGISIMTLKTKWIDFLYRVATGSRSVRNVFTPIGAALFSLVVFLFILAAQHVDQWMGVMDLLPGRLPILLSLPFFSIALFMIGWSVHHFIKAKGTPVPVNPPSRLVTSGPYAYSRNPMIAGVFALLFGIGVLQESVSLLFIFTPLFIMINIWELTAIEEAELRKRLGREYAEYHATTPMFFPKIRKRQAGKR
jgi:protein-S-isoprenylcysteine O-methyltransferase Ste14